MLIIKFSDGRIDGVECTSFQIRKTELIYYVANEWQHHAGDVYSEESWVQHEDMTRVHLFGVDSVSFNGEVLFSAEEDFSLELSEQDLENPCILHEMLEFCEERGISKEILQASDMSVAEYIKLTKEKDFCRYLHHIGLR